MTSTLTVVFDLTPGEKEIRDRDYAHYHGDGCHPDSLPHRRYQQQTTRKS